MEWLMSAEVYHYVLLASFVYAAAILVGAFIAKAPYGKLGSERRGINLSPRLGWFLMELPATLSFLWFYLHGQNAGQVVPMIFLGIWLLHYGNRGFIFPLLMRVPRGAKGTFSLVVVVSGIFVTTLHGYLNAVFISHLSTHMTPEWLTDPRFLLGMSIYFTGFILNIHSDAIIRNLRSKEEVERGDKVYRIPAGGLFRYVTNPSYFTELLSFTGFAIATWSPGALFVLLVSAANLVPRAFQVHAWYRKKFADYPQERKVLIPFLL
ncbi:3-oxo-5-alpha-steroid 4-dehydrogenase [Pseudohalioglobus sediminis]|uniref:3-oxo-5-alpha-steroid 4-dehydrogenase n=1 Tax=Pseudohalioglobus sediminis TaxID=2606449 RepID=A0A5B0WZX5_9GAMM|nr:methyltransferase [Pseudohalioglobus sediminis]KAA1192576.1 3-oxo-5-alpha-steroid 4-dehydrogenase [Pseudohalioglobus sediminis]